MQMIHFVAVMPVAIMVGNQAVLGATKLTTPACIMLDLLRHQSPVTRFHEIIVIHFPNSQSNHCLICAF